MEEASLNRGLCPTHWSRLPASQIYLASDDFEMDSGDHAQAVSGVQQKMVL